MKTYMAKPEQLKRKWYVVNAEGKVLGRLSSEIAKVLRGKNKPEYTPHVDTGDFVIVVNADKVVVTGKKAYQKLYRTHSGHPGGFRETRYRDLVKKKPAMAIELAVKRMLPGNSLGKAMFKKLKVYGGGEHNHQAQKPEELVFNI
jgi:large subunit ribosomal protein L13